MNGDLVKLVSTFYFLVYVAIISSSLNVCASRPELLCLQASPGRERRKKEVIMVDPLEAKRLAAKQMEEIKAKERYQVSNWC